MLGDVNPPIKYLAVNVRASLFRDCTSATPPLLSGRPVRWLGLTITHAPLEKIFEQSGMLGGAILLLRYALAIADGG